MSFSIQMQRYHMSHHMSVYCLPSNAFSSTENYAYLHNLLPDTHT